jgi:hypothetical protein
VYGNFSASSSVTGATGTNSIRMLSTTSGKTFAWLNPSSGSTAGPLTLTFAGVGGSWTMSGYWFRSITITAGTLDMGSTTVGFPADPAPYGFTATSVTSTKVLNLSSSTMYLRTYSFTSTNLTINGGTSNLFCTGTLASAGFTFNNFTFAPNNTGNSFVLSGNNTFNNLTFSPLASSTTSIPVSISGTQTINGTFSANGLVQNSRYLFNRNTTTASATINAANKTLSYVDFYGITAGGAAAPFSGTSIGDAGGNTNITGTTPKTVYWSLLAGGNFTSTAFATSSGGTPAVANFPLPQDTLIIDDAGLTTGNTINFATGSYSLPNITSTRTSGWVANGTGNFYGDLNLPSPYTNTSFSGVFYGINKTIYTALGISTATINNISGVLLISTDISVTCTIQSGGTVRILRNINLGTGTGATFISGSLDLNNFAVAARYFYMSGAVNKDIAFGSSGQITLLPPAGTTSQTVFISVASGFSYTGTSNITLQSTQLSYNYTFTIDAATTESQALNFTFSGVGGVYRVIGPAIAKNLVFTNNSAFNSTTKTVYGDLTLSPLGGGGFVTGTNVLTFAGASGTKTITTNGIQINVPITFDGNCTWQLVGAVIMQSTRAFTMAQGTVKLAAGTTNTVDLFTTTGATLKYLASTTPGTQATVSKTSGTTTVTYLSIQDSNATGGVWDATDPTNVNAGNTAGWNFGVIPIDVLISESLSLQDASSATQTFINAISEVLGLADSSALATTFAIAASEGITTADTSTAGTAFVSAILENLVASDSPAVLKTFNVSIAEPQTIQTAANVIAAFISDISEPTTIQESIIGVAAKIITNVTEAITTSDAQTAVVSFVSSTSESISVSDSETAVKTQYAIVVETFILDEQQDVFAWVRVENDAQTTWTLIDNRQ